MSVAFLTEMGFEGKVPSDHTNMRTEFAWMHALNADHYCIYRSESFTKVKNYDAVYMIFPKGNLFLNSVGAKLASGTTPTSNLLKLDIVNLLKQQGNQKVFYIQEGPHWLWNDYEIEDQVNKYNLVSMCDGIFAHNESDARYYRGLFPSVDVKVIPTLLIETLIGSIQPNPQDKVIIGGNFARWYGGFESYIVATEFNLPIWAQTSHAMREGEELLDNLTHLPRLSWIDWMKELSNFKYAVHLMPTVAAGTFSLNCAYFGIPTIGNIDVDTQRLCHPMLSVDVNDVDTARKLVRKLHDDTEFYNDCSAVAKEQYNTHFSLDKFNSTMKVL
jgi:hypothetical protein